MLSPFLRGQATLLIAATALLFGTSCEPAGRDAEIASEAPAPTVLVLGIDGFEWDVALPMLRAGRMPNLAALMQRGVSGTLTTLHPTLSPRLWTTVATGQPPEVHGILDFLVTVPGQPELTRHYNSRDRRVKAYWDILSDHGIRSDTIGWWMTYPVDEVLGTMVAQTNTLDVKRGNKKGWLVQDLPGQVWPLDEEERVYGVLEEVERDTEEHLAVVFGELPVLTAEMAERWSQSKWSFRADQTYFRIAQDRMAQRPRSQVTSVYVSGTDVVGHRFWPVHEPESFGLTPEDPEVAALDDLVESYYAYTDKLIGELVELLPAGDASPSTVFVVSDHGMSGRLWRELRARKPDSPALGLGSHMHREPGIFVAAGAGIREQGLPAPLGVLEREQLGSLGGLEDFSPTLLALLGVPYGEDMAGRPMEQILDPAWIAARPIESVATHEEPGWLEARGEVDGFLEPERVRQLENLGYLQSDD